MNIKQSVHWIFLLALVTSCHMDKFYANRRIPHDPPKQKEAAISLLQDNTEKESTPSVILLNEIPSDSVYLLTTSQKGKQKFRLARAVNDQLKQKKIPFIQHIIPVNKKSLPAIKTPGTNQNMAVFAGLLACSFLTGLLGLAYYFFTIRTTWIALAIMAISLLIAALVFLIAQPIK